VFGVPSYSPFGLTGLFWLYAPIGAPNYCISTIGGLWLVGWFSLMLLVLVWMAVTIFLPAQRRGQAKSAPHYFWVNEWARRASIIL
jgi:hypothetical protein